MTIYRYSYLFQRVRSFSYFFIQFPNELKELTGFSFEEWKQFHTDLSRLIERLILIKDQSTVSPSVYNQVSSVRLFCKNVKGLLLIINSGFLF